MIASLYDYALKKPEDALNYYSQFMATRPKAKSAPNAPQAASYYTVVEGRILELKQELKEQRKKP